MPDAWVHIGAGKCGSSLIQGLLNTKDALAIARPVYQPHLSSCIQSVTPCFDYDDYHYQETLNSLRDQIPAEDVLFSCENLNGVHTHKENSYSNSIKVLKHLFPKHDVKLLMFVRRQDEWIESMYGQDVKRQEIRSVSQYMEAVQWDNLHWDKCCEAYAEEFDLTVLPFERHILQKAGYADFVTALFDWLGEKVEVENLPVVNPSLSAGGLEVQMIANRVLEKKQAYDLSTWLERHCPKTEKFDLLGSVRDDVLAKYRDSNARLFGRFMPDFDMSYYVR